MDPITTTIVTAFVIGASQGARKVGDQAVSDAYSALKNIVTSSYHQAAELLRSIAGLETKPDSPGRRGTLAEELAAAGALNDGKLLAAAESVVAAAENATSTQTIGIDWQDVRAARLKVGQIRSRAGAVGFRAARMEVTGELEITGIDVAGEPGK
jgi:hypothetical protein